MRELKQDWRDVFLAFRIARDPRKVLLGAAGAILSVAWVYLLALFFRNVMHVISKDAGHDIRNRALDALTNPLQAVDAVLSFFSLRHVMQHPHAAEIFFIVAALGLLLIWSYFGGAISRIAAVELARDERIEMREARKFACHKFWAYLWAPIVPAVGVVIFGLCNFLGGLIGCIPFFGDFFMGIFFPLTLLAGFLIALITIGGMAGGGLMMPAISAEGTDAFDGISRAYSYVYSRPWRFIWYGLVALGYGLLCVGFIYCFTWLTVQSALVTGKIGLKAIYGGFKFDDIKHFYVNWSFAKNPSIHWWTHVGAFMIGIWAHLLWALFLGFVVSMITTCNTIIYFLMRKSVDGTEMTEVFMEEQEEGEGVEAAAEKEGAGEAPAEEKKEGEPPSEEGAKKRAPRKKKEEGKEEGKEQSGEPPKE